jgi:iron-sulfur cluster assembly protein
VVGIASEKIAPFGHALELLQMVTLTDIAAQKVTEFLASQEEPAETAGLRVGVRGGGCSGFQYALALDEQREGDKVFEDHGIRVIVDEQSLTYVDGSVVDFKESMMGAGFEVSNPNVVAACGCGSSFRVAEDEEAAECASTRS